jgi:Domain of unknown function (DUF3883)
MADLAGTWFTAVRLERLIAILRQVPSRRNLEQLPRATVHRILFPVVGGSSEEIRACVRLLEALRLANGTDFLNRTAEGDKVVRALRNGDPTALPLAILRSGCLSEQVQHLTSISRYEGEDLVFEAARMRPGALQLLGLLARLPGFVAGQPCRVQGSLRVDVESAWSLQDMPTLKTAVTISPREEVGNLGELYSLQLERTRFIGAAPNVRWVSPEDPGAGYDIEVREGGRLRRIEVKGSQAETVTFAISDNEWQTSERYARDYEIHFWGTIRPGEKPESGYGRLIEAGYPIVILNPHQVLSAYPWTMRPQIWRVRRDVGQ